MNGVTKKLIAAGGLTGAAVIALACGSGGSDGYSPDATPSEPAATSAQVVKDGTFKVGDQIKPGKYESVVPKDSVGCYWARLKDTSGNGIITNSLASAGSQVRVTIQPSDKYFETRGCGQWKPET